MVAHGLVEASLYELPPPPFPELYVAPSEPRPPRVAVAMPGVAPPCAKPRRERIIAVVLKSPRLLAQHFFTMFDPVCTELKPGLSMSPKALEDKRFKSVQKGSNK